MAFKLVQLFIFAFLGVALVGCSDSPVGSKKRPFTMYFVPSVDSEQIAVTATKVSDFLTKYVSQKLYGKDDGFHIKTAIPTSYIAVIEAFGTRKADFAALNTFGYILAKDIKKYDMEAVLSVIRGKDEKTFQGQIIAHRDSGIKKIEDLQGKKFAYTDPASTSGFILPAKLLKDKNVKLSDIVFAQKHDNVVTMVYQKQVDAGATYYSPPQLLPVNGKIKSVIQDARLRVVTQFPDVEDKVKIIALTQQIPNEPWVMRTQLLKDTDQNQKLREAVVEGLLEFAKTADGKEMLNILATATGVRRVSDAEFVEIRKIILDANLDLESVLKKTKG